jgi:hypothetical protein
MKEVLVLFQMRLPAIAIDFVFDVFITMPFSLHHLSRQIKSWFIIRYNTFAINNTSFYNLPISNIQKRLWFKKKDNTVISA